MEFENSEPEIVALSPATIAENLDEKKYGTLKELFLNAKNEPEISQKPERFRDFPKVNKEYCIGCGACQAIVSEEFEDLVVIRDGISTVNKAVSVLILDDNHYLYNTHDGIYFCQMDTGMETLIKIPE